MSDLTLVIDLRKEIDVDRLKDVIRGKKSVDIYVIGNRSFGEVVRVLRDFILSNITVTIRIWMSDNVPKDAIFFN